MIRFRVPYLPFLAVALLAGCPTPNPPLEYRQMSLLDVEAPATVKKGQVVNLKLTGRQLEGCWKVASAGATVDEATKSVTVLMTEFRIPSDPCQPAISFPTAEASFYPAAAGTYTVTATVLAGRETNETKPLAKTFTVTE